MTRNRGSSVSRSIRTRSIAPGAARWPPLIWAPSKAGPVGLDAASRRSRLPSTISAFVPTSTTSVNALGLVRLPRRGSPRPCRRRRGRRCTAGRRPGRPDGRASPSSAAVVRTARSVASANGARPERRRVDAEQEVVHDRVADDRELEDLGALDPGPHRERRRSARRAPCGRPRSSRRRPRDASSRTRRGSSGPRRSGSAGSSRRCWRGPRRRRGSRGGRRSSSSRRRSRRRSARSWKPGQTAMTSRPSWTATVTRVVARSRAPAGARG